MNRVLVVDDDELIREGIKKTIMKRYENAIEVYTASNGIQALKLIGLYNPQVIITDVMMPECDGLELIEKSRRYGWNMPFIIISGYDDFEYAKRALKNGAVDYLLKPIDETELVAAVKKSIATWTGNNSDIDRGNEKITLNNTIKMLLHNNSRLQIPDQNLQILKKRHYEKFLHAVCFYIINANKNSAVELEMTIYDVLEKNNSIHYTVFIDADDSIILLVSCEKPLQEKLKFIIQEINTNFGGFIAGISSNIKNVINLSKYVSHARESMMLRLYNKDRYIFSPNELSSYSSTIQKHLIQDIEVQIINAVLQKRIDSIKTYMKKYMNCMMDEKLLPAKIYYYLKSMLTNIVIILLETDVDMHSNYSEFMEYVQNINTYLYYDELLDNIIEEFTRALNAKLSSNVMITNRSVEQAKRYISENLDKDLSLHAVAEKMLMNPSYFSYLFKKETGMTYIGYVNMKRIQYAQVLLRSEPELKIYNIADRVGFIDVKYFSRVFKKIAGVSPSDYRDTFFKTIL
jgi:two-component system response regulator YesN